MKRMINENQPLGEVRKEMDLDSGGLVCAHSIPNCCYLQTLCKSRSKICVACWRVMLIAGCVAVVTSMLHLVSPCSRSGLNCTWSKRRCV